MLDLLLLSIRHHKISQSAETLPGELFLGEVSLYQLRRDIRSDLRAACRSSSMPGGRSKIPLAPPHQCLQCKYVLQEFKPGRKGKAAEKTHV